MRNAKFRKEIVVVMDRGFWSMENVRHLVSSSFAFIMCLPTTCLLFWETLEKVREELVLTANFIPKIRFSCVVVSYEIDASRRRTDKPKEMALYIFRDQRNADVHGEAARMRFTIELKVLQANHSLWNPKGNSFTGKYFRSVYDASGNIVDFCHNEQLQAEFISSCGIYLSGSQGNEAGKSAPVL